MKQIRPHFGLFARELSLLLKTPMFLVITLVGNCFILICCSIFWHLEHGVNPYVKRYMDAIWWGFTTATTTGYGNITPVTDAGKILSIILMLSGLALFAMYTALFAETIMAAKKSMKN